MNKAATVEKSFSVAGSGVDTGAAPETAICRRSVIPPGVEYCKDTLAILSPAIVVIVRKFDPFPSVYENGDATPMLSVTVTVRVPPGAPIIPR